MTDGEQQYDIAKIRALLLAAFTAEDLRRFCLDCPTFRPIVDQFGPGHGKDDMIDQVIEYSLIQLLFVELLAEVKRANPRQYARFEPDLYTGGVPFRVAEPQRLAQPPPQVPAPGPSAPTLTGFDQPVPGALLEFTLQRQAQEGWPVVVELAQPGRLPTRAEGLLRLEPGWQVRLLKRDFDPQTYGTLLGQALFHDTVRDAFMRARAGSQDRLRVLLVVEDAELRSLHWERLCGPIRPGGRWGLLTLDQRLLFSLYLPTLSDRLFPAVGRRDLQALVLVADPPADNPYGLAPFDAAETVASIKAALGDIPHHVLANVAGAQGRPTLDELVTRLTDGPYTLLHIFAHGLFRNEDGETVLYLLNDEARVKPGTATRLIERLDQVQGPAGLPGLIFLATCESAAPRAEAVGALGGLAQRLVRELGIPAVVAMTQTVSIATAGELASGFYPRLRDHGEVDRALVEAAAPLADAGDIVVPALYSRLAGRPLFSDTTDRDPTPKEIAFGLDECERLLPDRAPVLQDAFKQHAGRLRGMLGTPRADLSRAAQDEWRQAEAEINALSEEVLDLNFCALALGQQPPAYDGRCPFRGMHPFRAEDREFFFGREALVRQLQGRLREHNCLAVLGPSGCGKSSVVLAGLIPALQAEEPGLQMAYLTPGDEPLAGLEASLFKVAGQPAILVADQFEELFALCTDDAQRRSFLDRLLALAGDMRVVITMRADFWGECAPYRHLARTIQSNQELIAPMDEAEQRTAMEMQAAAVNLRFEPGLANTLLDDVRGEPGAMPLLQHALLELWNRRHGCWLCATEYRAIGRVQQAIAHTADGVYVALSPRDKQRVRGIFLRLTKLDEDQVEGHERRDTRRRVALEELVPAGGNLALTKTLVARLADARLVVTQVSDTSHQEEVEVAHEALIQHWPRLWGWLARDQEALRVREGIRRAAREWDQNDGGDSYILHRGKRLEHATVLLGEETLELNTLETAYLDACLALSPPSAIPERPPLTLSPLSAIREWPVIEPELVIVPGGPFLMGSDKARDGRAYDDELPQHEVTLPAFEIGRYPVTNAEYAAFVEATSRKAPSHWRDGRLPEELADHPVVYVSWLDAQGYVTWLHEQTDKPYRLPTEAEWEKAARGNEGRLWPWGDEWDPKRCNSLEGGPSSTTPVGQYSPAGDSPYGCADMAGNAWEWTQSLWGEDGGTPAFKYPYDPEDGRENLEAGDEVLRVVRGGSFGNNVRLVRCAYRHWLDPCSRYNVVGFRVVVAPVTSGR